jgi:hypothetical protein
VARSTVHHLDESKEINNMTTSPFESPGAPGGGASGPALHQFAQRLLIVIPTKLDPNQPGFGPGDAPRDRITADVIVCDGPPIHEKIDGKTNAASPLPAPFNAPAEIKGMWLSQSALVNQLRGALQRGTMVLGRLVKSTQGQNPWILQDPSPQDQQLASQVFAQRERLQWPPAQAQQFATPNQYAQQAPAAQQGWGQAPPAQQMGAQNTPQGQPVWGTAPQQSPAPGWGGQEQAPAAQAPQQGAPQGWGQQAPPSAPAAQVAPDQGQQQAPQWGQAPQGWGGQQ